MVTIDAMGCQREIAEHIGEKGGDYIFSLKGNQGTLHEDVKLVFKDEDSLQELAVDSYHSIDGSEHGRLEERTCRPLPVHRLCKSSTTGLLLSAL